MLMCHADPMDLEATPGIAGPLPGSAMSPSSPSHMPGLLGWASHAWAAGVGLTCLGCWGGPHMPGLLGWASHAWAAGVSLTCLGCWGGPHMPGLLGWASHAWAAGVGLR